jgi:phosphoribosylamine-glycine ligase
MTGKIASALVSEADALAWLNRYLRAPGAGIAHIVSFGPGPAYGADRLLPFASKSHHVADYIKTQTNSDLVFLLTNQAGLRRDADIGQILEAAGLQVVFQKRNVADFGADKIVMKKKLQDCGIPVTPGVECADLDQAVTSVKTGSAVILKHPGLSDARMSRVVRTSADVAKYYYDFNIQCPILAEPFVSGIEISCIAINYGKSTRVLPPVFKERPIIFLTPDDHRAGSIASTRG